MAKWGKRVVRLPMVNKGPLSLPTQQRCVAFDKLDRPCPSWCNSVGQLFLYLFRHAYSPYVREDSSRIWLPLCFGWDWAQLEPDMINFYTVCPPPTRSFGWWIRCVAHGWASPSEKTRTMNNHVRIWRHMIDAPYYSTTIYYSSGMCYVTNMNYFTIYATQPTYATPPTGPPLGPWFWPKISLAHLQGRKYFPQSKPGTLQRIFRPKLSLAAS